MALNANANAIQKPLQPNASLMRTTWASRWKTNRSSASIPSTKTLKRIQNEACSPIGAGQVFEVLAIYGAGAIALWNFKMLPVKVPEIAIYFHFNYPIKSFLKNTFAHFRFAFGTVGKNNWNLFYFEAILISQEFHLDLERIANKFDLVQRNGFENFAGIAFKAGGSILNRHSGNHTHVRTGKIRHQYPVHRPVHHVHAFNVAAANGHVIAFQCTGIV